MNEKTETEVQDEALSLDSTIERYQPELMWTSTSNESKTYRIDSRVVIGSAPNVDITIDAPAVSRFHAELELGSDGLWVKDLKSKNGTFIDNVRIQRARFDEGLSLRLGGVRLSIRYDRKPSHVQLWPVDRYGPIIGRSDSMREVFVRFAKAARTDATVLVQGETGTGKELVAAAIHESSRRVEAPIAVVDLGAVHPNLLEAELFGYDRGAFTGAERPRAGVVEAAHGGTVFLDEIGELPLSLQPKLLRLIENRTVTRLGEYKPREVDVRFIAATNRDLRTMVNEGTFREDLYFRLAVLHLQLPPLRDRLDDIPVLIEHFLPQGTAPPSGDLIAELRSRSWPGNVRELRNFVDRALVFGPDEALESMVRWTKEVETGLPEVPIDRSFKETRDVWLGHFERGYIAAILRRHGGNISAASDDAGLTRAYVHRLVRKHGLATKE